MQLYIFSLLNCFRSCFLFFSLVAVFCLFTTYIFPPFFFLSSPCTFFAKSRNIFYIYQCGVVFSYTARDKFSSDKPQSTPQVQLWLWQPCKQLPWQTLQIQSESHARLRAVITSREAGWLLERILESIVNNDFKNYLLWVKQGFILKFIFLKLLMTSKEVGSNLLLYYFEIGSWNVSHLDLEHKRLKKQKASTTCWYS